MTTELTRKQFDILEALATADKTFSQRDLEKHTGYSLGTVNKAIKELTDLGYIEKSKITDKGIEAYYSGKGYITEACSKLMSIGFEHLDLERIYTRFDTNNKKSGNVMERLGMKKEGELRHLAKNPKGEWKTRAYYSILKEEYFNKVNTKQSEMWRIENEI